MTPGPERTGPLGRRVLSAYSGLGWRARAHTRGRWHSAPLRAVERLVPAEGRILDLGCGHGLMSLLLAEASGERTIHGVDVDAAKVGLARRAAAHAGLDGRVRFDAVDGGWRPQADAYDGIVVLDVLYLLGRGPALALVRDLAGSIAPGGRLLVKEIDSRPRWKYLVNRVQEQLAVRILSITEGDAVEVLPMATIGEAMAAAGLAVERHELHHGYPHAHVALAGNRPDPGDPTTAARRRAAPLAPPAQGRRFAAMRRILVLLLIALAVGGGVAAFTRLRNRPKPTLPTKPTVESVPGNPEDPGYVAPTQPTTPTVPV